MASTPLPGDPRTRTDWRHPESSGLVKIDCDTPLERTLFGGAVVLACVAAVLLWDEYVAPYIRHWEQPIVPPDRAPLVVLGLVGAALVLVGARAVTDNFYLIDRAQHLVYFHAKFLWIRRVRLRLDRANAYAVSVQSRRRQRREWGSHWAWATWWEERVVVIDRRGRLVPMSNWAKDALWTANNQAKDIASALGCQWFESPQDGRLVVRMKDEAPVVSFAAR